jgi:DNA-binding MarR family transcriptional regulator
MSTKRAPKAEQALLEVVGARLRQLTTAIDGLDQRAARRLGVNRTDLRLLDVLAQSGPLSLAQLGRAQGISSGGMTVAIDRLTLAGYVRRRPHGQDRRSQLVELTPQLWSRAEPILGALQERLRQLLRGYSQAQLQELAQFLLSWQEAIAESGTAPPSPS